MNPEKRDRSMVSNEPELTVLNTLISATHKWTDTQEVLSTALEQVTKLSDADGSECHLVNSVGELQFMAQYNLDTDFTAGSLDIRFPLRVGLPGRAYASQSAIFVPDITSEEHYLRKNLATQAGYHSLVCIPLSGMDTLLGTFTLYYREKIQPITDLQSILTTIGKQMGIAIERARLFQQNVEQLKELQVLQTVAGALNRSADIQDALESSLEALASVMNLLCGWVVLLDDAEGARLAASYNLPPELSAEQWVSMKTPCSCLKLLKEGQLKSAVNIVECQQLQKIADLNYPYIHHASIPINAGNKILGNLNLVPLSDSTFTEGQLRLFTTIGEQIGVAVERALLHEEVKAHHIKEQEALLELSQALLGETKAQAVTELVVHMAAEVLNVEFAALALVDAKGESVSVCATVGWPDNIIPQLQSIPFETVPALSDAIRTRQPVLIPDELHETRFRTPTFLMQMEFISSMIVPIVAGGKAIGGLIVNSRASRAWSEDEIRLLALIANQAAIAIDNTRLFESLTNEQDRLVLLHHLSLELATSLKPGKVADRALQAATNILGVIKGDILTLEEGGRLRLLAVTGYDHETVDAINHRLNWDVSRGVTGRVVRTREAIIIPDVSQDADWVPFIGLDDWVRSMLSVPLVAGDIVIGALNLLSEELDFFKIEDLPLILSIATPLALSLQNTRLHESLHQRLKELEILANTSSALRKAQSFMDMPPILLTKTIEGLKANAGVFLLLENDELKIAATHGEISVSTGDTCPAGAVMMWQVLNSGETLFIPDITQYDELHKSMACQALMGDALSCVCVPLRTTTSTIGIVFLNWKKKTILCADELRLLESIAEIASNAIHRSILHTQTMRQALDLTLAYDATIEGWSRALDLRDRETEGHTQRVANLTLQLTGAFGISEPEIVHLQRGALLHDIGKMGISDDILRKPGALSDEEWTIMRKHPQLAYEMLSPIAYLQPALDIPYCHHEKWDGTGYPRGLRGEQIPLAARIFAVADVWDALTSDRPYRKAWSEEKTLQYIREQAGKHFDPKVVQKFLEIMTNTIQKHQ